jgi:major vault protein
MANDSNEGKLVLAQNQHAFVQDSTKGTVQVYAGPQGIALSGNDRPVIFDPDGNQFLPVDLRRVIQQNPMVPENHYLVLENPRMEDGTLKFPNPGTINSPVKLDIGRKINIPGPTSFPLWPGQFAKVIPGHHLHSNQYLLVRVYNAEEANKNRPTFLKTEGDKSLTPGQLLVIKGTEVSFFIPPTGFEVLQESGEYVREALTLERLEYCILLDEDGNKRYERGPKVVFPEATEQFMTKDDGGGKRSKKFKAIELNPQMGLYIKVIADYTDEDGTEHKTGEELFVTGKEQQIFYPRPEHALIEYEDPQTKYKRQRYYGITIPKGEGRYVLDKSKGAIEKVTGPQIFLADPRNQVIVRRVLDPKTVGMWYPNNEEALAFNQSLASLSDTPATYLADNVVLSAAADLSRGMNRGTQYSKGIAASASFEGDTMRRGTKFTPPPMLTLNTKYDGIPSIDVWTGYAVEVVDKSGNRRVQVGPSTILLEYDETLTVLELSTGKPKNTDKLHRDVYLRVDNNLVSDVVYVETKDLVKVNIKVSYRVNFLREHKDKWFSVENYVKFLCDHMRSLLKAKAKTISVKDLIDDSATLVRDTVLGPKTEEKRSRIFEENGMAVYDVEVLETSIMDNRIATLLQNAQQKAVESAITLSANEQNLEATKKNVAIQSEIAELEKTLAVRRLELQQQQDTVAAETLMVKLKAELEDKKVRMDAEVAAQEQRNAIAKAELGRTRAESEQELADEQKKADIAKQLIEAVSPELIAAINNAADMKLLQDAHNTIAPLAIFQQQGLETTLEQLTQGTAFGQVLSNLKGRTAKAGSRG